MSEMLVPVPGDNGPYYYISVLLDDVFLNVFLKKLLLLLTKETLKN